MFILPGSLPTKILCFNLSTCHGHFSSRYLSAHPSKLKSSYLPSLSIELLWTLPGSKELPFLISTAIIDYTTHFYLVNPAELQTAKSGSFLKRLYCPSLSFYQREKTES